MIYTAINLLAKVLTLALIALIEFVELDPRLGGLPPPLEPRLGVGGDREQREPVAEGALQPANLAEVADAVDHDPLQRAAADQKVAEAADHQGLVALLAPELVAEILECMTIKVVAPCRLAQHIRQLHWNEPRVALREEVGGGRAA